MRAFMGANDSVDVYVPGGSTTLDARSGNMTVEQGAVVDVSSGAMVPTGNLNIHVARGNFKLNGEFRAGATSAVATAANPERGVPWRADSVWMPRPWTMAM